MITKEEVYARIKSLLLKEGASRIAVFGSFARGEARHDSDVDILVDFKERKSLLDLARIERVISENLGMKIDLLTEKAISPYLIDRIKEEMEVIHK
ncbi:nucleotidyltransferase family protein [candidate division WOR-3 bacterium]|nr:nucleotidyltransferase family protein [candidate division WOR-3 bacterium]